MRPFSIPPLLMLKQRIITAVLLLALFVPALFAPQAWPFVALSLLLMAAGVWEWGRLNGRSVSLAALGALVWLAACGGLWLLDWHLEPHPLLWLVCGTLWILLGTLLVRRGVNGWGRWPATPRWLVGGCLLALAWLAMVQAHAQGANFLLSLLALVWVADVMAYFAGRAFGGRWVHAKLAPSISPGKSWEGVFGGAAGVLLVGGLWRWADGHWAPSQPSLFSQLAGHGELLWVLALLVLTAMSVVGDLVESLVKRSAGVKDSSGLLPGHGGVLDRVDALLPTLPLAMMLATLMP